MKNDVTIGFHIAPQYGDMKKLREVWIKAEELGVDRLWTADHFHAQVFSEETIGEAKHSGIQQYGKNFEATTIQAAMAATTTKAEIGCLVHSNSYRNPNLMADIARTIDHLSNGRFILGMGAGYLQPDYDEYGYEYGTPASRLADLARDLPIIKARFGKLNPQPVRPIPLMVAAMGDKVGLRIVAEHADLWHIYGPVEKMQQKLEILKSHCKAIGRDPSEIECTTTYVPAHLSDSDPDTYVKLGMKHIMVMAQGPDWDIGPLKELLAWRKALA